MFDNEKIETAKITKIDLEYDNDRFLGLFHFLRVSATIAVCDVPDRTRNPFVWPALRQIGDGSELVLRDPQRVAGRELRHGVLLKKIREWCCIREGKYIRYGAEPPRSPSPESAPRVPNRVPHPRVEGRGYGGAAPFLFCPGTLRKRIVL